MEEPRVMTENFAPNFSLNFLCISQAPLGWALWCGYYWKNLFHLQKLNIDDANFGPISDDVRSGRPRLVTACTGVNGLKQNCKTQKQKQQYKFLFQKLQQLHGFIRYWICLTMNSIYLFFSQSWCDCFAERLVSKIWSTLDNKYY